MPVAAVIDKGRLKRRFNPARMPYLIPALEHYLKIFYADASNSDADNAKRKEVLTSYILNNVFEGRLKPHSKINGYNPVLGFNAYTFL